MSSVNDSNGEMPVLPLPRRDGGSALDGATLDRLLRGAPPDDRMSPEARALAELVAAARRPAMRSELTGEEAAVAAFVAARGMGIASGSARRRSLLATGLSSKLAAAAAAGVVSFAAVAAAAYAGALPEPIQDFAHQMVGAPAAGHGDAPAIPPPGGTAGQGEPRSDQAVGPDPTGPALHGLCTAFAGEKVDKGKVDSRSPAYAALAEAAGGADKIEDFCASMRTGRGPTPGPAWTPAPPTGPPPRLPPPPPTGNPPTPAHPTGPPTAPPIDRADQ